MNARDFEALAAAARKAASEAIGEARQAEQSGLIVHTGARLVFRAQDGAPINPQLLAVVPGRVTADLLRGIVREQAPAEFAYISIGGECVDTETGFTVGYWDVDTRELRTPDDSHPVTVERWPAELAALGEG